MTPNGSPSIGATPNATPRNDEKAAAIAALTDLMDELEELSVRVAHAHFSFPFHNSESNGLCLNATNRLGIQSRESQGKAGTTSWTKKNRTLPNAGIVAIPDAAF